LREERRLRVFKNRVLRKIFGPKRDEGTGEWRKLHNEEINDLYCSPNIVRVIKSGSRDGRGIWGVGKRPLGRPRRRWDDNIKMDLQEVGCGGTDWIELA